MEYLSEEVLTMEDVDYDSLLKGKQKVRMINEVNPKKSKQPKVDKKGNKKC